MSHSSHIHSYLPQREGVAALPCAEIFCIQYRSEHLPISESTDLFSAGGDSGPPLRGRLGACGQALDSSPWLCRGGLPRPPVVSIVDLHYRLHLSLTIQAQKKRRMLCIVVSRLPALFERLMLLDYQIGLNFASGVGSWNIGKIVSESARV